MATAATGENEFDILTCSICLEKLKSPKSLPCSHSFCEVCIGEFILSTERRTGVKLKVYPCPVCRAVVTPVKPEDETSEWASALPKSVTISARMDQSESTKQECQLCKTESIQNEATHWCRNCSDAFCDDCLRIHNRMKISAAHKVVRIEQRSNCNSGGEPELSSITDTCSLHKLKILDAYCFDHQEVCCVHCLTLHHRKCENVQAIDIVENLKNDKIETLQFELTEVKSKMDKLAEERNFENEKLISVFKQIETNAKNTTETAKEKLDGLLVSVIKELNLIRDEQTLYYEENSEAVKSFLNRINQLQNNTNVVQKHGSLKQKFIHFEKSKIEFKSAVKEVSRTLNSSSIRDAKFVLNETLDQALNSDCLGNIDITRSSIACIGSDQYERGFYQTKSVLLDKTRPSLSFDNVSLKHRKTINFSGLTIFACVYKSEEVVILGGKEKSSWIIRALDISNENVLAEYSSSETIKRLEYDFESKSLFVSCCHSKLFSINVMNGFESSKNTIKTNAPLTNGGLCVFEGILYILVDNAVQKISIENTQKEYLKTSFTTKENCSSLNGLAVDCNNRHLLHTSNGEELVCTSLSGEIIFSYKDEHFVRISCLAVHPRGIILIGSGNGAIYAVSDDGRQMRILLNKCKKFKEINDICCNNSLTVCGSNYIEIYDVKVQNERQPQDSSRTE